MNDRIDYLRDKANRLPMEPGVYLMKDEGGNIIYVGKAKVLKNRVTTYFRHNSQHTPKTLKLVSKIYDFDFIVTKSELDALVLECSLIKLHQPKYNILLKDDKGYNYIKISRGAFPRITYSLNTDDKNADYIGPFTSGFTVKQAVEEANALFMLPTCRKSFPRDFNRERPCLNHHIKRCMGVCEGKISSEEYKKIVEEAVRYLKNGSKASVEELTAEMEQAAENLEFERAARLRDRIAALSRLKNGQSIFDDKQEFDIVGGAQNIGVASFAVIKYRGGRLVDKENFFIGDEYEPAEMRRDFLVSYYSEREDIPKEILIDEDFEDAELIAALIREHAGHAVKIYVPRRGEGIAKIALARKNAGEYLALRIGRTQREITALEDLRELLGLAKIPEIIESYDISNFGETGVVGGMVVYKNGRPLKSAYKRFSIKTVDGQNDYACMQEVLRRRITRFREGDESFAPLPDLILLDGGRGHISAVSEVFEELGVDIPLFGLVKDSKHRTRAIAREGGEIEIKSNRGLFAFLTNIQDEVHRWAISYQRIKHKQALFTSELRQVKGIGEAKQTALLRHFKTKQAMKAASVEELREAAKIGEETAKALYDFIQDNF
ncbi:MAG TPA: excinuclease ABC subunit UvrC [Ruminococcaceae bacterium]|nr:excinuclease ABC subunit UvrC [Oscillospiraceae bacterium]